MFVPEGIWTPYSHNPLEYCRAREMRRICEEIRPTFLDGRRWRVYDTKRFPLLDLRDVGGARRRNRQRTTVQRLLRILRARFQAAHQSVEYGQSKSVWLFGENQVSWHRDASRRKRRMQTSIRMAAARSGKLCTHRIAIPTTMLVYNCIGAGDHVVAGWRRPCRTRASEAGRTFAGSPAWFYFCCVL